MNDPAREEFFAESREILTRLSSAFVGMEKNQPTASALNDIYRDIHSLKGGAYLFGFKKAGELAHLMESCLEPVRGGAPFPVRALVDLLCQGLDLIERMLKAIRSGAVSDFDTELKEISPRLIDLATSIAGGSVTMDKDIQVLEEAPVQALASASTTSVTAAPVSEPADGSSGTIRVQVALLDRLMTLMGEMVLVRNQMRQYSISSDDLGFLNLSQRLDVVTSELQGEMMKTRMQPISAVLGKFQRMVRDLAKDLSKKVEIELSGMETELDKTLLEAIKDPLTHIIRNSCDHGIELPAERKQAGKPEAGRIHVRAFHEGGQVVVEISDDGRGLNRDKLLAKAVENGLVQSDRAQSMSDREVYDLIFAPGFSTAAKVTNVSGRGVGMDVVRSNIEKIGGVVELQSIWGRGMNIRIKIPLTLAIVPAMIARCGNDSYAIPQVKLLELVRVENNDRAENRIEFLQGKPVYRLRGNLLPLVSLDEVLGGPGRGDRPEDRKRPDAYNIVVLNAEHMIFGLIVDEILDTADIVVKPLSQFLKSLSVYSGATVLGDGSVALILDVMGIAQTRFLGREAQSAHKESGEEKLANAQRTVETQEFLLFKLDAPGKYSILLSYVHRLEEFKRSDFEFSGQRKVVRYRDSILPIVALDEILNLSATDQKKPVREVASVIVAQKGSRLIGIEVDEILDVLATEMAIDTTIADRPGVMGSLVASGEVIVVVDPHVVLDQAAELVQRNGQPHNSSELVARRGARVLYTDDMAFYRRHVSGVLQSAGYQVVLACDGADAIAKLEQPENSDIEIVLSDIEMPKLDGFGLVEAIRKNPKMGNIKTVALTTRSDPKSVKRGLDAGFDAYLEKMNRDELLDAMDRMLKAKERKAS